MRSGERDFGGLRMSGSFLFGRKLPSLNAFVSCSIRFPRYFRAFLSPPTNTFLSFHSGSRSIPTISGEGVVGKSVSFSEMRFSEVDKSISSTVERSTSGRGLSGRPTAFAM